MHTSDEMIPLSQCEDRAVYEIQSRNLAVGVFVKAEAGFIGIRTKFGSKYLFMEFHYDIGAPFGTVEPIKKLSGAPHDIPLKVMLDGTRDRLTQRPVKFDRPIDEGGRGWYFLDTGEGSKLISPVAIENETLFQFLENIEKAILKKCKKCAILFTPSRLDEDGYCLLSCTPRIRRDRAQP
jgi:hypothetical protein